MADKTNNDYGYDKIVGDLRKNFRAGKMRSYETRLRQLQQLDNLLTENKDVLQQAIYKDLHTSKLGFKLGDYLMAKKEVGFAIASLKQWMQPESRHRDAQNKMNTVEVKMDPLGVVLIIAAWNYPIGVLFAPMVGALAAGNCVVVKPSEVAANVDKCLGELFPKYFDPEVVQIISGGIPETTALLRQRFDHIMYTGNSMVGKIIMKAAAEYLTPVTLELGGKCPTIIDDTSNFDVIAQRIAWSKFMNCGQICLTTDYIIYLGEKQDELIESLKKATLRFYGDNPQENEQYGRIINARHYQRVCNLIDESKVVHGNVRDADDLYLSPTIMANVTADDKIMKEEVFGPVLPILKLNSVQEAVDFINDREKPLGLYIFSNKTSTIEKISSETSSGGITVNDTIVHATVPSLPFGGVGNSGMGCYREKLSFDCFTHKKAFLHKSQGMEFMNELRYPCVDTNSRTFRLATWMVLPQ